MSVMLLDRLAAAPRASNPRLARAKLADLLATSAAAELAQLAPGHSAIILLAGIADHSPV